MVQTLLCTSLTLTNVFQLNIVIYLDIELTYFIYLNIYSAYIALYKYLLYAMRNHLNYKHTAVRLLFHAYVLFPASLVATVRHNPL